MKYVASLACIGYSIPDFLINFSSDDVEEVIEEVNTRVERWCRQQGIKTSVEHDFLEIENDKTMFLKLKENDIAMFNDSIDEYVCLADDNKGNRLICLLNKF